MNVSEEPYALIGHVRFSIGVWACKRPDLLNHWGRNFKRRFHGQAL